MRKREIFTYVFCFIVIIITFYLSSITWVLKLIFTILVYFLVIYFFYFSWKKLRKKDFLGFFEFFKYFLYKLSLFATITIFVVSSFAIYQNKYFPAKMPQVTLSNGEKTIIFQAMSHIATRSFYEKVTDSLRKAKQKGFVYFFEGVRPWNKENMEYFNKALWIEFDENLYKNLGKLYWVVSQDNNDFLWLVNNNDFNVDLSIDEIVELYKSIEVKKEKKWLPYDANKHILDTLSQLNDRQLRVLVYINKSMLNFIIKSDKAKDLISNNFWNKQLFKIILDKRNEKLVDEIINSSHKKIFITYWLLHFDWVFELLKGIDDEWEVTWEKFFYPIK